MDALTNGGRATKGVRFLIIKIPHHISGLWIPVRAQHPLKSGSIGAGLNISITSRALVVEDECTILLNGQEVMKEQAEVICNYFQTKAGVRVETPFILGTGFATSSSLLISQSLANAFQSGKPSIRAFQKAHELEVIHGTGLGDVISQYYGGFVIRTAPGPPGIGSALRIPLRHPVKLVVASLPRTESTADMLKRTPLEHYQRGLLLLRRVENTEDLVEFFHAAREFTMRIFDYSAVPSELFNHSGVVGFYLKKSALIIWVEKDSVSEIVDILSNKKLSVYECEISKQGVDIEHTA